jgi:hypothetical protein
VSEPDPAIAAGLDHVANSVTVALGRIQATGGSELALCAATLMVQLAVHHVATQNGPKAARDLLAGVWTDLHVAIAAQNGGSATVN